MTEKKDQKPLGGSLHHVELYTRDLKVARAFWEWFLGELGYEKFQEWEVGTSWKLGHTYIVVVQVEEKYGHLDYHRCGPGLNHLAFHATDRAQVDRITESWREKGGKVLYEDRHPYASGPDYYALFLEGPERIKVELVAPE